MVFISHGIVQWQNLLFIHHKKMYIERNKQEFILFQSQILLIFLSTLVSDFHDFLILNTMYFNPNSRSFVVKSVFAS